MLILLDKESEFLLTMYGHSTIIFSRVIKIGVIAMRLQIYMSPMLSERLCKEALDKQMKPCELADQILKDHFGIREDKEDYQKALHNLIEEIDQFLKDDEKVKKVGGTFTLLDFESFRSIGTPAVRSAVGRGIAKYFKERKDVEYCRDANGEICKTRSRHAAIYKVRQD